MKKQSYQRILAVLISLMILLTAGMAIVGAGLLQTREDSPDILPEATDTADSGDLLMSSDLAPDPAKGFLPYDGDLTDADGNPVRLSALRGQTTILLFWSSWCPDCHVYLAGDFGAAVQAAQAAGAQVVLVCREGIRGDTREKAEAELTECGITGIPLYMDADAALFHTLGLRSVPSLAFFDSQGQLLRATADMPNADEMAQLLDAAQHPAQQTLAFLKQLIQADGAIPSTYTLSGGAVHPGDTVLSETMGQTMLYAVQTEDTALFSGKQGVFGQDMLPYTHWLQQSHPHSLTADDGLVPVDAGPDGIPHISLFFMTDWRVESFRLCHSCKLYRITDRLRQR